VKLKKKKNGIGEDRIPSVWSGRKHVEHNCQMQFTIFNFIVFFVEGIGFLLI